MLQDIYTITDGGSQKTFMVNPQSKTYYEQVQQKRGERHPSYDPECGHGEKETGI